MTYFKKLWQFYLSQEPVTFWSITCSALSALVILGLLIFNLYQLPPQLPLYYSQPWGEKQLALIPEFIILPAIIVLISLVNLIISWHLHTSQLVLKRMMSAASLSVTLVILVTALKILFTFI